MKKYLWIFIVAGAVAGTYFWGGAWINKLKVEQTPVPGVTQTLQRSGSAASGTQVYTSLVATYANRRIQFDQYCQAVPNNITYKSGTIIMLDNRSGDARVVSVGGIKYQLSGYGYAIVKLSSTTLPKTLYLNCGAAINVGQILLQK